MMEEPTGNSDSKNISDTQLPEPIDIIESFKRIDNFIDDKDVGRMINLQASAIKRLESTNRNLIHCNNVAQSKLASTTRLYKKTAKQMKDSKKDLDYIYEKLLGLKQKIRAERPDLFSAHQELNEDEGGNLESKKARQSSRSQSQASKRNS